jgi:TfoX/Sxy family transcriptional regulator of competence genes
MDNLFAIINFIRETLSSLPDVEEKNMFQGTAFMVDNKLCIAVRKNTLLCRIGAQQAETELEQGYCTPMINNGRTMKDFVFVDIERLTGTRQLPYWIDLCLQFNPIAKASKKKKQ